MERHAAGPLGDQGQHDVAAVAVGEPLAGRELRRVAVEHGEVLLGGHQLVHRHRQQVVGDVELSVLVEVVADPRPVRQQVLDGDGVVDQRQVIAEHATGPSSSSRSAPSSIRLTTASAVSAFRAAGDREPGIDPVRDAVCAAGQAVRLGEVGLATKVHPHYAGETGAGGERVDLGQS